jgi:thioredoxin-like negative regulator of GroEL
MPANRSLAPESTPRGRSRKTLTISLAVASVLLLVGIAFLFRSGPNAEILRQEATNAAQQGRWAEAEASLGRLTDPTPSDWLLRAVVATSLNQPEAASGYLAKIPRDSPLEARVALVTSRVELGRFRARPMEDALRHALQLDPKLAEARRSLVYLYGIQGRRPESLEQFAALVDQGPLSFNLVRHWCISHQEEVQVPEELQPTLEHFVENDPEDRWSRLALARAYRRLGLFDRSKEWLAPLPDRDPDARACRAEIELARGDEEALKALLADGPADHPTLARLRGQMALNRGDGEAALKFFRLSDAAEPNYGETVYGIAQALRLLGDRAAAEPYARRVEAQRVLIREHLTVIDDNHDSKPVFYCRIASECEAAGYVPEARAWYRLAIIADVFQVQAHEALSRLNSSSPGPDTSARSAPAEKTSKTN